MKFKYFTLFPDVLKSYLDSSIMARAQKGAFTSFEFINIRDYSTDRHGKVDDTDYGGDPGMILTCDPLFRALEANISEGDLVIYVSPQGVQWRQNLAELFVERFDTVAIINGHYKGIDQRVIERFVDVEISVGDFILSGGELASLIITDSVVRLKEGVIGDIGSAETDSFSNRGLLDCDRFTKPRTYQEMSVPDLLAGGNHAVIRKWQLKSQLEKTINKRYDLFDNYIKRVAKETLHEQR